MRTTLRISLASAAALALAGCLTFDFDKPVRTRERPNILLVVADDLGYSDLGCYGGEIRTPHLDALAESGLRATDFYVASRGAPSRAMLMTGVDNHVAGFGSSRRRTAHNQEGLPGYAGHLSPGVVTVASLLRAGGYHTVMAGKWELGESPESRPAARGFERSFALHDGAASHWSDMTSAIPGRERAHFTENGEDVKELPEDYFSTRYFTDFAMASIEEKRVDGRPFFAYLAYQAPHGPLAAPEDWLEKNAGRYDEGFDAIRGARLMRMKTHKLVPEWVRPYPGIPTVPNWKDLSETDQRRQARKMELYAAMVENLDHHVGRLLDYLREIGEYDDTLIVFLSDNGAEPGDRGPTGMDRRDQEWFSERFPVRSFKQWGQQGSFIEYGPAWAQVSMVPFRLFKGTQAEGGIRSPLILSGVGVETRTSVTDALLHVTDLTPTFLELAKVPHPRLFQERSVAPLQGSSLLPLLSGRWRERNGPNEWLGMAFAGDRAVRRGDWKLVWMPPPFGAGKWRLYRLDRDPAELFDRAEEEEDKMAEGLELWEEYAQANGVVLPTAAEPEVAENADASEEPQP